MKIYTRRQLMMDAAIIKPPKGYEWVEYIENTSNAYIDTGVVLRAVQLDKNIVELDMDILSLPTSGKVAIFGNRYREMDVDATFIEILADGRYHTTINATNYYATASTGRHKYSVHDESLYIDNVRFGNKNFPRHSGATIALFAIHERFANTFSTTGLKARLYGGKVEAYDAQFDFYPVIRLSDNKYGLWNIVNKSFYTSPNNQKFTGGKIINRYTL